MLTSVVASRSDKRRRWTGAVLLGLSVAMLLIGELFLTERLRSVPVLGLIYWLACFGFVFLAIVVALVDWIIVRKRLRVEQRGLVEETLSGIVRESRARDTSGQQNEETRRNR